MKSWSHPAVPSLPGTSPVPRLHDTSTGELKDAGGTGEASLYVCGITPYDATHIGHANTYLAYDTLVRLWLDRGCDVRYVQNVTDIDDPLLERAKERGIDWQELAESQIELFRGDMTALSIIPPHHYVGVTEVIDEVADAVHTLLERGYAYPVPSDNAEPDLYFDTDAAARNTTWRLGLESNLDSETMLALSAERGGDPRREGKRNPLDPLLWRSRRDGEPSWASVLGEGRPGWHIECTVIALNHHATSVTVNGGGSDLVFPHHEFSAAHATALTGEPLAKVYSHTGMVAYQGEKMSKSLGNLVFVSELTAAGVDPRAIRLALLAHHYRSDWEWTDADLQSATERLGAWRAWAAAPGENDQAQAHLDELRTVLADDLNTPAALDVVDGWVASGRPAAGVMVSVIDALLGVRL
ncbi:cysteine--1-D-myo-inosityl 2-amino-2-deoxy-alpha-D-glucopyranoside ligase [Homoserinimonas sp. A447]